MCSQENDVLHVLYAAVHGMVLTAPGNLLGLSPLPVQEARQPSRAMLLLQHASCFQLLLGLQSLPQLSPVAVTPWTHDGYNRISHEVAKMAMTLTHLLLSVLQPVPGGDAPTRQQAAPHPVLG
jgi:hypothetical protein